MVPVDGVALCAGRHSFDVGGNELPHGGDEKIICDNET